MTYVLSTLLEERKLSKEEFLDIAHKATWKEYSPKTSKVSQRLHDSIVEYRWKKTPATPPPTPSAEPAGDIAWWSPFWGSPFGDDSWFLSSLWIDESLEGKDENPWDLFAPSPEKKEEAIIEEPVEEEKKESIFDKRPDFETHDAVIVWREETKPAPKKKVAKTPIDKKPQTSESGQSAQNAQWWNKPTFTKWVHAPEKKAESSFSISKRWEKPKTWVKKVTFAKPTLSNTWWKWWSVRPTYSKGGWWFKRWWWVVRRSQGATAARKHRWWPKTSSTLVKKESITMFDTITVKEFAEKAWLELTEVMKVLLLNKIVLAAHASMDYDTAMLIGEELWVKVIKEVSWLSHDEVMAGDLWTILAPDKESETKESRPPIVTIMGHVDHGKTKLLDYIRQTNVVDGEAWWITQSIWASQAMFDGKKITFVDTPGHELFTSMRSRWSKITDIVIIVIAWDEWIKAQTVEAIDHAKAAWVPILVAITKIDKPNLNIDQIMWQIAEQWLTPEDRWGDTPVVHVSAMTGQWMDDMLETILLLSELQYLVYDPDRWWIWVVLESHMDSKQWVVTSMILMTWTLKIGDIISVHDTFWKVKKMTDWKGKQMKSISWWEPAMILWIQEVPKPWRIIETVKNDKEARERVSAVADAERTWWWVNVLQSFMAKISEWQQTTLNLIIKADSVGTLEAVKYAIGHVELPENIGLKYVHSAVWSVNASDISLAEASEAVVVCFNVSLSASIKKAADTKNVVLKSYDIIYELTDYLERLALWLVKVEEKEVTIGAMDVLAIFYKKWKEMILWGKVAEWKITNGAYFYIKRGEWEELEEVWKWKITSLKRDKENVNEVAEGHECGIRVKVAKKIQEWDTLSFYVME